MEELCFWMALTCNSQMRLSASTSKIQSRQPRTLYDWFNPETIVLIPKVVNDNDNTLLVDSSTPSQQLLQQLTPRVRIPPSVDIGGLKIPIVQSSQILLQQNKTEDGLCQRPAKVFNGSAKRFFKPTYSSEQANREISALVRIHQLGISELRVPTLHEVVQSEGDSHSISGMLLEYIEHHDTLRHIIDFQKDTTSLDVRAKRISQLRYILRELHASGIVWGDAKPDNVLVGTDQNLWLVDFGGGFTQGWVDEDKMESFDGDLQALSRMVDLLL